MKEERSVPEHEHGKGGGDATGQSKKIRTQHGMVRDEECAARLLRMGSRSGGAPGLQ